MNGSVPPEAAQPIGTVRVPCTQVVESEVARVSSSVSGSGSGAPGVAGVCSQALDSEPRTARSDTQ